MSEYRKYSIVSPEEAKQEPYPYVYVEADRTVRELHESERQYLEQEFLPFDGGRPYVKDRFESIDGWGSIAGFCPRSLITRGMQCAPAPVKDPSAPMSKSEHIEWLRAKMNGFDVVEMPDGTIQMKRVRPPTGSK